MRKNLSSSWKCGSPTPTIATNTSLLVSMCTMARQTVATTGPTSTRTGRSLTIGRRGCTPRMNPGWNSTTASCPTTSSVRSLADASVTRRAAESSRAHQPICSSMCARSKRTCSLSFPRRKPRRSRPPGSRSVRLEASSRQRFLSCSIWRVDRP